MNPATIDELLDVVPNKYLLTMVIAARAKQLEQGAERMVDIESSNSLDIAIKEIAERRIDLTEILKTAEDALMRQLEEEKQLIEENAGVDELGEFDDDGGDGFHEEGTTETPES